MKSDDITVTDARFKKALNTGVSTVINQTVPQMITAAVNECSIRTGVVTKFYPYLDKAEVQLDNINQKVLCKLTHRYMGSLIDLFTPVGDNDYCDDLKEPCIIPHDSLNCCVMNIHNDDSDEYLLLDYFNAEDIIGFSPARMGSMKLTNFRVSGEDYIEFGGNGLKIKSKTPIESNYGEYDEDISKSEYVNSFDVYTKDEVYTKEEVDELIQKAISEALGEDDAT